MSSLGVVRGSRQTAKLVAQVVRESAREGFHGEAAKVAFFFFVSLFPMIMVLFALTGILGGEAAFDRIMGLLRATMPAEAAAPIEEVVAEITGDSRPGVLSVGIAVMLWAASNSFNALMMGFDLAWQVRERRRWLSRRLLSLATMAGMLVFLVSGSLVLLLGPEVLRWIGIKELWDVLRWPAVFVMIVGLLWLVYYLLPNLESRPSKRAVLAGALVGTSMWLLATAGFRTYVATFGAFGRAYGVVAGVLVLLIWLYLTALSILVGAKFAAVVEDRERERGAAKSRGAASAGHPSPS